MVLPVIKHSLRLCTLIKVPLHTPSGNTRGMFDVETVGMQRSPVTQGVTEREGSSPPKHSLIKYQGDETLKQSPSCHSSTKQRGCWTASHGPVEERQAMVLWKTGKPWSCGRQARAGFDVVGPVPRLEREALARPDPAHRKRCSH